MGFEWNHLFLNILHTYFLLWKDKNSFSPLLTNDLAIAQLPRDESKNCYRSSSLQQSNRTNTIIGTIIYDCKGHAPF